MPCWAADLIAGSGATVFLLSLLDHPGFTAAHAAKMRCLGLGQRAGAGRRGGARRGARHQGGARLRIDRAPVDDGEPADAPREKRNRTDGARARGGRAAAGRRARARRRGRRAGRDLEPRPRSLRRLHRPRAHARGRSTTTAGTRAATSACSTPTATSPSPTARRTSSFVAAPTSARPRSRSWWCACRACPRSRSSRHPTRASASAPVRSCALRPGAGARPRGGRSGISSAAGLARQKWPEELRIVDEFPRTPSGKIKKFALRERLRAEHGRAR